MYEEVTVSVDFSRAALPKDRSEDSIIFALEERLTSAIPPGAYVSGREIGIKFGSVQLAGPSADAIWTAIQPVVRKTNLHRLYSVKVTMRLYDVADDSMSVVTINL